MKSEEIEETFKNKDLQRERGRPKILRTGKRGRSRKFFQLKETCPKNM